jgi:RimJ/RimL family protein N-acetyltransferase
VLTVPDATHARGEAGLGVARCMRSAEDPGKAEFACTVVDREQGHHLGTLLMSALSREAQAVGIDRFEAVMWADNLAMANVMHHLGEQIERSIEGAGVIRAVWRLHPQP